MIISLSFPLISILTNPPPHLGKNVVILGHPIARYHPVYCISCVVRCDHTHEYTFGLLMPMLSSDFQTSCKRVRTAAATFQKKPSPPHGTPLGAWRRFCLLEHNFALIKKIICAYLVLTLDLRISTIIKRRPMPSLQRIVALSVTVFYFKLKN